MTLETRLEQIPLPNRQYLQTFRRHKLLAGLSQSTVNNYTNQGILLSKALDNKDFALVTREDIENYVLDYKARGKASTVSNNIIAVRLIFADAFGKEKSNELFDGIRIKVPLVKVRDEQLLTADEIKRMVAACYSERDRALIMMLYASGCRAGELLGLKIRDVTFGRYGVSLHVNGKTGERDVDLFVGMPELKAYYNVHPHRDDPEYAFWVTNNGRDDGGRPLSRRELAATLERIAKRAKIPPGKKFNPHAFRHKRATDCAEFLTVADLKEMFGWTNGSDMPSVYVHSSRQRVKEKLMIQAGIKVPEQHMPTMMVKQCPNCGCVNTADATICYACSSPLNEMDAKGLDVLRKKIEAEIIEKLTKENE